MPHRVKLILCNVKILSNKGAQNSALSVSQAEPQKMHDAAINSCPIIQLLYRHQGFAERKNTAVATYTHSDSSMGTKSFLPLLLLVGTCISTAFCSLQKEDCRPLASAIHRLGGGGGEWFIPEFVPPPAG